MYNFPRILQTSKLILLVYLGVSHNSARRYSMEQYLTDRNHHFNNQLEEAKQEPDMLLNEDALAKIKIHNKDTNDSKYEIYGFIYKLKAYELGNTPHKTIRNLKRVELV